MGFFNALNVPIQCLHCGQEYAGRIQFKFGATRQLEYQLGDTLAWGYNEEGKPHLPRVKVHGILENDECPKCGVVLEQQKDGEYDILVENDVLKSYSLMITYADYSADLATEGCYAIL
ncbi:hypothetical protein IC235_17305 [Hymenobacter sp. BT664]|uniref:Uncharacterized protein n=1 Tax=Hymenobacter montanus TaxID=2771359 RepID=A0A927BG59_9BACT|nr:hypothetical protein [Hymenobacter montanus]MBD2769650.1 hypothetical protein [Hymenobacter montanus]